MTNTRYYQYRILAPTSTAAWLTDQQIQLIKLIFGDTTGLTISEHQARTDGHSIVYINIQTRQKGQSNVDDH